MLFTEHTDSPIVLPNAIRMIWSVVNRLTRSGRVLGPDERLDVYSALLSVTRYAAIQAFEENYKGSLEYGKLADLVVLDSNPLKVKPDAICQVLVLETIKAGKTVYRYIAEHTK
jgi:predicted amidohydrolase YtcJ